MAEDPTQGQYPATDRSLKDQNLKIWHEVYGEMRDYASSLEENQALEQRLLLDDIPEALLPLRAELAVVKMRVLNASTPKTVTDALRLAMVEDVMVKFVREWTEWMTGMAVEYESFSEFVSTNLWLRSRPLLL